MSPHLSTHVSSDVTRTARHSGQLRITVDWSDRGPHNSTITIIMGHEEAIPCPFMYVDGIVWKELLALDTSGQKMEHVFFTPSFSTFMYPLYPLVCVCNSFSGSPFLDS